MTTQILERPVKRQVRDRAPNVRIETERVGGLRMDFDIDSEFRKLSGAKSELIVDRDELGRRIMQSAVSDERDSYAVKCRSVSHATDFATPMRSMLLAMTSGFGGISATVSPSLNLNTWPAMDMLVSSLEDAGAGELWQPIGERSIAVGASRHIFVSVDHPIRNDSTRAFPNVLVEVVGAHLIDPDWFDRTVAPRCQDESLTFVFYGQTGFAGSLFERAWDASEFRGQV